MPRAPRPRFSREEVTRLWFELQGLHQPRGTRSLGKRTLREHLESTGALQLDSVNVLERAHYLTLWSRFGAYDRARLDRWTHRDGVAYEYWGHEASLLPISHLPHGRRRMRSIPEAWKNKSWWKHFDTPVASRRRVLRRLREEGALESADFDRHPHEPTAAERADQGSWLPKEDKRSLKLLWHTGRVAVRERRHFRQRYDLAERVLPDTPTSRTAEYEDSWLLLGLRGNGIAPERHLRNYFTAPNLDAASRKRVLARNLRAKRIVEVDVEGERAPWYALPEHLERATAAPAPTGTTLVCPFDSFLWQRQRADELLDFEYRIEIYVPEPERKFGYYVLPILHDGRLVGRLDPKLHRDEGRLEIRALHLEPRFRPSARFRRELDATLADLAKFVGAERIDAPPLRPSR